MKFTADFHVHSKFSRACAKNLDLENLYICAQQKGIKVVGTGDFTHPGWIEEIKNKLVPAEPGLYKLKEDLAEQCDEEVFSSCRSDVRFILTVEISNIYKKNGKTRKNHNLVFMPDIESVEKFNSRLDNIGNIKSDGRPILGLDARDLLEIVLDTEERGFLVPAHIWTPWFSLFGSKSGFDSIEECFEDLTPNIFAIETGLSSDPPMNWRISDLDNITLISNSDAHSPMKLGREANLFNTELNFNSIKSAMKNIDSNEFIGTYEFYPEEGKYHLDGHRNCNIRLWPEKTNKYNNICPVCGKKLTIGVLYRVEELSNRKNGEDYENKKPYLNIIPLNEIFSEVLGKGPKTKTVMGNYMEALKKLGPEFEILNNISKDKIDKAGFHMLGEAINRMRKGKINISPGFDGEFGKIKIFSDKEKEELSNQKRLFYFPESANKEENIKKKQKYKTRINCKKKETNKKIINKNNLNTEQQKAVDHQGSPLLIVAGPGTGKTLTITHKAANLIKNKGVNPESILAVTFTKKAASEMNERLRLLLDKNKKSPFVATFHSLCFRILKDLKNKSKYKVIDEKDRDFMIQEAVKIVKKSGISISFSWQHFKDMIISAKQKILDPSDNLEDLARENKCSCDTFIAVYRTYQNLLSIQGFYDYEDLIFIVVKLFEKGKNICGKYQEKFKYIFIDEYQDLNSAQYRIIKALAPSNKNICAIGDPDQSIYGFRGSDVKYFKHFIDDYPEAEVIHLKRNYRSTETILEASFHVIKDQHVDICGSRTYSEIQGRRKISILELGSEKSEAVAIGKIIESMVGGIGFFSHDFGKVKNNDRSEEKSFSDIAVLYRTNSQGAVFADAFEKSGIPYQIASRENAYCLKGIRELISFFRILHDNGSYADFERIVKFTKNSIGLNTIEIIKDWCYEKNMNIEDAIENIKRFPVNGMKKDKQIKVNEFFELLSKIKSKIQTKTIKERLVYLRDNIKEIGKVIDKDKKLQKVFKQLIEKAEKFPDKPHDFLESISLDDDTDLFDYNMEKIALMTMHASKGLEFPVVFIAGCENGYLPFDNTDIDEEKRLFYVAMTRAKESLYLTHVKERRIYGKKVTRAISPFVDHIEKSLIIKKDSAAGRKKKDKEEVQVQLTLF